MKKVCVLFSIVLLATACPMDSFEIIWVKNKSNETIVITGGYILPDTLLPQIKPQRLVTISVNESRMLADDAHDRHLTRMKNGERLTIFVLSKDSVDNHSWEYLRENNVILKRYEFNWQELQEMGGSVSFP